MSIRPRARGPSTGQYDADVAKKQRAATTTRTAARKQRRSNYPWHRRVPWVAVGGAVIGVIAILFIARQFGIGGGPGQFVAGGGQGDHRPVGQAIAYSSYPPTSGTHWESPTTWGFHTDPVADEFAVHNMEHGGVVVSYNNISGDDLARLRALLTSYPRDKYGEVKLLIRPYDKVAPGTIALTAWNWIDVMTGYDEARVRAFMDGHLNRCCEDVP